MSESVSHTQDATTSTSPAARSTLLKVGLEVFAWCLWGLLVYASMLLILKLPTALKRPFLSPIVIMLAWVGMMWGIREFCNLAWNHRSILAICIISCGAYLAFAGIVYRDFHQFRQAQMSDTSVGIANLLQKGAGEDTPEQRELERRMQEEYDPSFYDFLRWKYSALTTQHGAIPWVLWISETVIAASLTYLIARQSLPHTAAILHPATPQEPAK